MFARARVDPRMAGPVIRTWRCGSSFVLHEFLNVGMFLGGRCLFVTVSAPRVRALPCLKQKAEHGFPINRRRPTLALSLVGIALFPRTLALPLTWSGCSGRCRRSWLGRLPRTCSGGCRCGRVGAPNGTVVKEGALTTLRAMPRHPISAVHGTYWSSATARTASLLVFELSAVGDLTLFLYVSVENGDKFRVRLIRA